MIKYFCKCECGKEIIKRFPSQIRKGYLRGHFRKYQPNPNWKGGQFIKRGYIFIYSPNHPYKDGQYVKRSRLIMEKELGRFLLPTEIIHHLNRIRNDDRIENLRILTRSQHTLLHIKQGETRRKIKAPHKYICQGCGKTFYVERKRGFRAAKFCSHSCAALSHKRTMGGVFT